MGETGVQWSPVWVPVGWGWLAGKVCVTGGKQQWSTGLRVLCVHGLLDNANSFDVLVPLLPAGMEVLAIDLPGHGLSDHLPYGACYNPIVYAVNLYVALKNYGWDQCVVIGHSLGACAAGYLTACFPNTVMALVNLDNIIPNTISDDIKELQLSAAKLLKTQKFHIQDRQVYSEDETVQRLVAGHKSSRIKEPQEFGETEARVLLPRATRPVSGGFIFSHDAKIQSMFRATWGHELWLTVLVSMKCPVLIFTPSKGLSKALSSCRIYQEAVEVYSRMAACDIITVEGCHNVHLCHPERVAPALSTFLTKVAASAKILAAKL